MKKRRKEQCDFCVGEVVPRRVRVVRQRDRKLVVIENVPAQVCDRCGMRYYDAAVVRSMEAILKRSKLGKRTLQVRVAEFEVVA